jgi:hypothetical protein
MSKFSTIGGECAGVWNPSKFWAVSTWGKGVTIHGVGAEDPNPMMGHGSPNIELKFKSEAEAKAAQEDMAAQIARTSKVDMVPIGNIMLDPCGLQSATTQDQTFYGDGTRHVISLYGPNVIGDVRIDRKDHRDLIHAVLLKMMKNCKA